LGVRVFLNTFRRNRDSLAKFSGSLTSDHRPAKVGVRIRSKKYVNRTLCCLQISLNNSYLLYSQKKLLLQFTLGGQCSCGRTNRSAFTFTSCLKMITWPLAAECLFLGDDACNKKLRIERKELPASE